MSATSTTSFVQLLQQHGIVSGEQAKEIARTLQPRFADPGGLAKELVRRGYLTAFQAGLVLQGRGQDVVVGAYRLLDRLGKGGMGEVFKARHVPMDRVVALKLIQKEHLAQPEAVARFFREARAAAQLSHPNIVIAHDAGQAGAVHFLAMEYVEGVDLARLVQQSGRLTVAQGCDFIRQAALGLQHAFEKGVVHRDIKPGNLLAAKSGGDGAAVVKILDFGLARFASETGAKTNLTQLGKMVGTVDYISPEQAENARKADIRSDIYSLGCSLFYLLTGQPPFGGETGLERLSARLVGKPVSIRALRPEVPGGLEQVLAKMLARDPARRFQTPAEVAAALQAFSKPGNVKAGAPASASGKTVAGASDGGSGKSLAGKSRSGTAGPSPNPFASLQDEDRTSVPRSSPARGVAKPKAKAAGKKGRMLGLAIGGVAAVLAGVLVVVLMHGKKDPGPIPKIDDGPGAAVRLVYSVEPTNTVAGVAINPAVTVRIEDALGNLVTSDGSNVTVAIGTNPGGGVLSGTLTVVPVNGIANFSNLSINKAGAGYTLTATNGMLNGAGSNAFNIAPAPPHHLVFALQPTSAVAGQTITPAVTVRVEDALGNLVASDGSNVTVAIGTNPGGGVLSGMLTVAPVDGVASFSNLSINKAGAGYTLTATNGMLNGAGSNAFNITPAAPHQLAFVLQPTSAVAGQTITPAVTVRVEDALGNLVASDRSNVTVAIGTNPGGGVLSGTLTVAPVNGVASFSNLSISKAGAGYTLTATDGMLNGAGSNTFNITPQEPLVLQGHTDMVYAVAFSPDGKRLASAGDKTVRLWDVDKGLELHLLPGHNSQVTHVAFSPDGKRLASASWDGTVRLWDVDKGQELHVLPGHTRAVKALAFSPDGKRLASVSGDKTVRLWDVDKGQELRVHRLKGHAGEVTAVAFSLDGKRLASVSGDKTVRLWDVDKGQELHVLPGHTDQINAVAFSPDGMRLASASLDKTVRLWDVDKGQELRVLKGHAEDVWRVEFSPDGKRLASASWDNTVRLWDVDKGQELHVLWHTTVDHVVAFSPDGQRLASTSRDGPVWLWDMDKGQAPLVRPGHTGQVVAVAFSPDGKRLASASWDKTVRLWDVDKGPALPRKDGRKVVLNPTSKKKAPLVLRGHTDAVRSVAFSPDGKRLASAGDNTVRLWDVVKGQELHLLSGHTGGVAAVAFNPDGKRLASVSGDKTVRLWDVDKGQELRVLHGHTGGVAAVAFSPDGSRLASASHDNTVRLWDVVKGQELHLLSGHTGGVAAVAFSPDGKRLASASWDNTVRLWDVDKGKVLHVLQDHTQLVTTVAFSPDGKQLASASWDNTVRLWDVDKGKVLHVLPYTSWVRGAMAFSPEGKRLASASLDGAVRLWDVDKGKELLVLRHTSWVGAVAFSPDGKRLASASWDGTVWLWDVDKGKELLVLPGHADQINAVAFSPDGKWLASASDDNTVRLWDVDKGQEPPPPEGAVGGDERKAAEWVLSIGGSINVTENGVERQPRAVGDLPRGAFELTVVELKDNPKVSDAGLAHFKDCKNLNFLNLQSTQVGDAGLAHFKDCTNLTHLDLSNTKVSDAGIDALRKALPKCNIIGSGVKAAVGGDDRKAAEWVLAIGGTISIKEDGVQRLPRDVGDLPRGAFELTQVVLTNNPKVSDAGLAHFKDCKNLKHLGLGYNTQVSDAGLASFKDRMNLTSLQLHGPQVTDAGLAHFKYCKKLVKLHLGGPQVTDAGLAHFKDCTNLESVDLQSTQVSDAGLAHFKDCKNLKHLGLGYNTQVSDAGLASFKDRMNLTSLQLHGPQVTDAGLAHFKYCKKLVKLHLGGPQVTDAGLAHFKDCTNLETLALQSTQVIDAGLGHFNDCRNLKHLSLLGTPVSCAGLAHFKDCTNLESLDLHRTRVNDAGLAHFKDFKNLKSLDLRSTQVSDAGLAHFKNCKNLEFLGLDSTQVSDTGLAHFKDCKNLWFLSLSNTKVGDAGLAHFKDCKNLKQLNLRGTKASAGSVGELQKPYPSATSNSSLTSAPTVRKTREESPLA